MTFSELGLNEELLMGLEALGFETPTPIQQEAIPVLLEGERDLVALAQTGTGKTAGFGLPMLQNTEPGYMKPQSIVLSPTRELGNQIADDLRNFSKSMKGIKIVSVYGGANISTQIKKEFLSKLSASDSAKLISMLTGKNKRDIYKKLIEK